LRPERQYRARGWNGDKAATVELELGQPDDGSDREDGGGARDLPGGLTGAVPVLADGRSLASDDPAFV